MNAPTLTYFPALAVFHSARSGPVSKRALLWKSMSIAKKSSAVIGPASRFFRTSESFTDTRTSLSRVRIVGSLVVSFVTWILRSAIA